MKKDKTRRHLLAVDKQRASFRDTIFSALILAIASMGDAFLYVFLPANYQLIGISSFWVGIILSINRFTRLFLNGRVAWFLNCYGIKIVTIVAILIAFATTISYGWMNVIYLWVFARVLWGISFSTLRLGNTLYSLERQRKGIALGISRSLIELGSVIALLAGPYLLLYVGQSFTFLIFGLISLVGILLVFPLKNLKTESISKKDLALSFPSAFNVIILVNAFLIEGILVVLLIKLIPSQLILNLVAPTAMVGILLGYRRLSLVLLSPLSGWLADKWGFQKVFIYTTIFSTTGLLLIFLGATITGIVATFTFSAINASSATGGAINSEYPLVKNVSDNATWRDIGTASGAFAGALLLANFNFQLVFLSLLLLSASGLVYYGIKLNTKTE